jgi:hypothetical protein
MYRYEEYPRVVYGPSGEHRTIARAEERPEGWQNHPADFLTTAKDATAEADAAAKATERDLRAGYREFLDLHHVDYAKNLGTAKLGDLVQQLQEHLAALELNEAADDGGE